MESPSQQSDTLSPKALVDPKKLAALEKIPGELMWDRNGQPYKKVLVHGVEFRQRGERIIPTAKLFLARMDREGKRKEFNAISKRMMAETGKKYSAIRYAAMREMGYKDGATELKLAAEWEASDKRKEQAVAVLDRREKKVLSDFEKAITALPDNAAPEKEIGWIRAHPAMFRLNRMDADKGSQGIKLTPEDVVGAPSKAAVSQLQHWCNVPHKFFEMILSEDKKKTEEGEAGGRDVQKDLGLVDVKRLLSEVR